MNQLLASIRSPQEAELLMPYPVDIIDLKEPSDGALGALPAKVIQAIVKQINGQKPVSATIGDFYSMPPDRIADQIRQTADCGVDYVKIGFFPDTDWSAVLNRLPNLNTPLIAVFFADTQPDLTQLHHFQQAGFSGVMLDTMSKTSGSLTRHCSTEHLTQFIQQAHCLSLLSGLAGSLTVSDVADLLPLAADYLGFRSALCRQQKRQSELDIQAITELIHCFTTDSASC
jgi:uncharacterized protein (UPF0264 family)